MSYLKGIVSGVCIDPLSRSDIDASIKHDFYFMFCVYVILGDSLSGALIGFVRTACETVKILHHRASQFFLATPAILYRDGAFSLLECRYFLVGIESFLHREWFVSLQEFRGFLIGIWVKADREWLGSL